MAKKSEKRQKPAQESKIILPELDEIFKKYGFYIAMSLVFILIMVIYHDFLFLNKTLLYKDIGSDSINVFYTNFMESMRNYWGEQSNYSFSYAMGKPSGPTSYYLGFNIFSYLLMIFGKSNLAYGLAFWQVITVFSGGVVFYFYMTTMGFSRYTAVVGSILFAFTGFIVLGTSGWFGMPREAVAWAFLMLGFERFFMKNNWWLFPISVFFTIVIAGIFSMWLYGIFLIFYGIFRFFSVHGFKWKEFGLFLAKALILGIIGLLMNYSGIIGSIQSMLNSPRGSGLSSYEEVLKERMGVFDFAEPVLYKTSIMRLFSNDMMGNGITFRGWGNLLEAPINYFGLINLILIPQLFLFLNRRQKILYLAMFIIWMLPNIFPYIRNMYFGYTGDYFRHYSLVWSMLMLYMGLRSLNFIDQMKKINNIVLAASLVFFLILLYYPYKPEQATVYTGMQNTAAAFLVVHTLIIGLFNFKKYFNYVKVLLIIAICAELGYFSYITVNERLVVTGDELEQKVGFNDYSLDAVNYIKSIDKSFYRIDKDFGSGPAFHQTLNDALVQNYFGTSSYQSFNELNYIKFLTEADVIERGNENQTRWAPGLRGRPILESISSVKYFLTRGDGKFLQNVGFVPIQRFGNVTAFYNTFALPLGYSYDKYITFEDFSKLSRLQKDVALLRAFVIEDDQIDEFKEFSRYTLNDTVPNFSFQVYRDAVNDRKADTLIIPKFKENLFLATIKLNQPMLIYLSIPYNEGWKIKANGQEIKTYKVNIGFTGIKLQPGDYKLVIRFGDNKPEIVNILLGWLKMVPGIALLVGLLYLKKRKNW
jgi:uncharacterized membrane protein YfhO